VAGLRRDQLLLKIEVYQVNIKEALIKQDFETAAQLRDKKNALLGQLEGAPQTAEEQIQAKLTHMNHRIAEEVSAGNFSVAAQLRDTRNDTELEHVQAQIQTALISQDFERACSLRDHKNALARRIVNNLDRRLAQLQEQDKGMEKGEDGRGRAELLRARRDMLLRMPGVASPPKQAHGQLGSLSGTVISMEDEDQAEMQLLDHFRTEGEGGAAADNVASETGEDEQPEGVGVGAGAGGAGGAEPGEGAGLKRQLDALAVEKEQFKSKLAAATPGSDEALYFQQCLARCRQQISDIVATMVEDSCDPHPPAAAATSGNAYTLSAEEQRARRERAQQVAGMVQIPPTPELLRMFEEFTQALHISAAAAGPMASLPNNQKWLLLQQDAKQQIEEMQRAQGQGVGSAAPTTVWAPHSVSDCCMVCEVKFTWLVRRHHCRQCGALACAKCSNRTMKVAGEPKPVRVCNKCFRE